MMVNRMKKINFGEESMDQINFIVLLKRSSPSLRKKVAVPCLFI